MCQNGGELWLCDKPGCERAVCSDCIKIPAEERSKLESHDVKFTCVSCHWLACRNKQLTYWVSYLFIYLFI
jgi:hypothetical protein